MHELVSKSIEKIWQECVKEDYRNKLIASEAELQSCAYFHLRKEALESGGYASPRLRIFVEPTIKPTKECDWARRRPDFLITSENEDSKDGRQLRAIAVVEFKLEREKFIEYEHELERIRLLCKADKITIKNQRPEANPEQFEVQFDDDTIYFLGFLGKKDGASVTLKDVFSKAKECGFEDGMLRQTRLMSGWTDQLDTPSSFQVRILQS